LFFVFCFSFGTKVEELLSKYMPLTENRTESQLSLYITLYAATQRPDAAVTVRPGEIVG
tara:strand:- start:110 stop:286 length:177 start_codon:yes stop_codon:yes gene_type:complete